MLGFAGTAALDLGDTERSTSPVVLGFLGKRQNKISAI